MPAPNDPDPANPGPGSAPAPGQPAKDTFELAPEDPAAPPSTFRPAATPAGGTPKPAITAPGLTEGFDEDADFEHDPEVDRAMGKGTAFAPRDADLTAIDDPFIKPGMGEAQIIALIGAGVLLSAFITAWIVAPSRGWAHALLTAYSTLLHTGTGVGALMVAALLAEKKLGKWELGAARMLLAVALFQLVFHIPFPAKVWLAPLAAVAAYSGATLGLFRLPFQQWFIVAVSHFGIWIVIEGLVWLNTMVYAAPKAAGGP